MISETSTKIKWSAGLQTAPRAHWSRYPTENDDLSHLRDSISLRAVPPHNSCMQLKNEAKKAKTAHTQPPQGTQGGKKFQSRATAGLHDLTSCAPGACAKCAVWDTREENKDLAALLEQVLHTPEHPHGNRQRPFKGTRTESPLETPRERYPKDRRHAGEQCLKVTLTYNTQE